MGVVSSRRKEEKMEETGRENSGGHLFELTVSQNLRSLCQGEDFKGVVATQRYCFFILSRILLKV